MSSHFACKELRYGFGKPYSSYAYEICVVPKFPELTLLFCRKLVPCSQSFLSYLPIPANWMSLLEYLYYI
jgi:hypothetical protein